MSGVAQSACDATGICDDLPRVSLIQCRDGVRGGHAPEQCQNLWRRILPQQYCVQACRTPFVHGSRDNFHSLLGGFIYQRGNRGVVGAMAAMVPMVADVRDAAAAVNM